MGNPDFETIAVQVHARWHRALDDIVSEPLGPIRDHIEQHDKAVRRAAAADMLREMAEGIEPGDHDCFKPWCPDCRERKIDERRQQWLRDRADQIERAG